VLALLHFYEVMEIPSLVLMKQRQFYDSVGQAVELDRLCSTGIYDNPNSLSRILVVGMGISLYWLFDRPSVFLRLLGLVSAGIFGFANMLTHSRGGFIALMVGTLVFFLTRFGWRKSLPFALLAFPLLFLLFSGRQTDIDPSEGTGQQRIQLWNKGFSLFQGAPLLGIGMGKYEEEAELVAHNSFIHCYAELGFLGGTLFTGAVYLSLWSMYRLGLPQARIADRELQCMRPCLMAIMAAYAAGMCTISISYQVPTYMLFGLSTVYLRLAGANPRLLMPRLNGRLVFRLGTISAAVLVGFYVYVRLYI
jgi:O-antigen ligase